MPISERIIEDIDVLFLCNSLYAFTVASPVKDFIRTCDKEIKTIYNVSSAGIMESTYKTVKKLCSKNNLNLSDKEFHCRGSYIHNKPKSHPDEKDLAAVKKFAQEVMK
jgi:hypothetical protein